MGQLSDKEMLLLANYVYMDVSLTEGTIGDTLDSLKGGDGSFDKDRLSDAPGGMTPEQAKDLLTIMDSESDDFKSLHVARSINDGGIRGVCFADEKEREGTVVFRGTGGTYDAWRDNVLGEYRTETAMQKRAADFVRYECAGINSLSSCGHSKGGNLAQYVSIMCPEMVASCVSFDGQGFNKKFIKENKAYIDAVKDRIRSVCAYNDYVNILLTPVAGERIFLENKGKLIDGHSSYTLLKSCKFDEDGNISKASKREQGPVAKAFEEATDFLVGVFDILPEKGNVYASNILAAAVASAMSSDMGDDYEKNEMRSALKAFKNYSGRLLKIIDDDVSPIKLQRAYTTFDPSLMAEAAAMLSKASDDMKRWCERVEDLSVDCPYILRSKKYIEKALNTVNGKTLKDSGRVFDMAETLMLIKKEYEDNDRVIADEFTGITFG